MVRSGLKVILCFRPLRTNLRLVIFHTDLALAGALGFVPTTFLAGAFFGGIVDEDTIPDKGGTPLS